MSNQKRVKVSTIFSSRINELIKDESVSAFARRVGLRQATVDRYVRDVHSPNADALLAIATHCGVTTDWLLGLSDSPNRVGDDGDLLKRCQGAEQKLARVNKALGFILKGTNELQAIVEGNRGGERNER
ncbi:MAG: helix-turn-helix domain-containing protein [Kiritimatiellaeota bacterium]|nr:helix-turn-helix domain-containing protein [Kiritimatiellota bacterium]